MPNSKASPCSDAAARPNPAIADRERAAEMVRKERDFTAAVLNTAGALIVVLDKEGRITRFNHACEALTGYSAAEVVGRAFWEFLIPPEELPGVRRVWEALQAGDFPNEHQNHWLAKDGSRRLIAWSNTAIVTPDGKVDSIIGTGLDMTERKRTDDVLRVLAQCGSTASGEDFFQALARYLGQNLGMDFVCIDRLEEGSLTARTVAIYFDGKFEDNVSYALKDTPCGEVVGKTICCFPRDVRHLFPKDAVLQEMMAESYVGVTLWGSQGQPIGLIALLARQPLADLRLASSILQVVAVRAAAELGRREAEAEIRRHADELRAANDELTRFNRAAVGRELRMIELKQEINAFCALLGQPPRYPLQAETEPPKALDSP
jgi:PAS domain S-box-containing protein